MIMFHQYEETLDLTVAIREFLTLNRAWICCVLFARFAPNTPGEARGLKNAEVKASM